MIKNVKRFQIITFGGFSVFGFIALASWVYMNIIVGRVITANTGTVFGEALIIWLVTSSISIVSFALFAQVRPLQHKSLLINTLSITGITFIVFSCIYVALSYILAINGISTNTPVWAFVSYLVKTGIIISMLLMHSAFVFSYKITNRILPVQVIASICAVIAGLFIWIEIGNQIVPDSFRIILIAAALCTLIATALIPSSLKSQNHKLP